MDQPTTNCEKQPSRLCQQATSKMKEQPADRPLIAHRKRLTCVVGARSPIARFTKEGFAICHTEGVRSFASILACPPHVWFARNLGRSGCREHHNVKATPKGDGAVFRCLAAGGNRGGHDYINLVAFSACFSCENAATTIPPNLISDFPA